MFTSRSCLYRAHPSPPARLVQLLEHVDQVGEDPTDHPDLVGQLGKAVREQELSMELVAALCDQLLQLVDVVRRAEGGRHDEREEQLLGASEQVLKKNILSHLRFRFFLLFHLLTEVHPI